MCGIFGAISRNGQVSADKAVAALDLIRHRGPDESGLLLFYPGSGRAEKISETEAAGRAAPIIFGHRRLSIIDLSPSGNQPMRNESGDLWVTFNGEIYNYPGLRRELLDRGHVFSSTSDTEVILHGYEEYGIGVIERLRGMFAFGLLDAKAGKIFLVRDRMGVKPLKYHLGPDKLVFASETKSIAPFLDTAELNLPAVDAYLTLKYVPEPETIYSGIKKVPAGHFLEADITSLKTKLHNYWQPVFLPKQKISYSEAKDAFQEKLRESVLLRLVADVPVGIFLSGGIDSTLVVAAAAESGATGLQTFTMGFDEKGYDETRFARLVAEKYGTLHRELRITPKVREDYERLVSCLDEPFADPSAFPTYYLARETSKHLKVVLNGDGSDEIFGGYKRYYIQTHSALLRHAPGLGFLSPLRGLLPFEPDKKRPMGRVARTVEGLQKGYFQSYLLRFGGLSLSTRERLYHGRMTGALWEGGNLAGYIRERTLSKKPSCQVEELMAFDYSTYLPEYILYKSDMVCMANSLEGRSPFMDQELVRMVNAVPAGYKFKWKGKKILKDISAERFGEGFARRRKMGFNPPIKAWLSRELKEVMADSLLGKGFICSDILRPDRIKAMAESFIKGADGLSDQLWTLLVLETWRRINRL